MYEGPVDTSFSFWTGRGSPLQTLWGLAGGQEPVFLHRVPRREGWHVPGREGCQPHWAGRGLPPQRHNEKVGIAVKCPPGGSGKHLLVDLAELNFHVCIWTEHPEVSLSWAVRSALLLHVTELLTAYQYIQSSPCLGFAMCLPEFKDSEWEM